MKHFGILAFMVGMAFSSVAALKAGEDGQCMPQKRLRLALKGAMKSEKDSLGMKRAKTFKIESFNPLLPISGVPLRKIKSEGCDHFKVRRPKILRINSTPDVNLVKLFPVEEEVLTEAEESDTE